MTRREFFAAQASAIAAGRPQASKVGVPPIAIFSKHLQWLAVPAMADAAKEAGFRAVDLTVRKGGHVEPANVTRDLAKAAKEIRSRGLELPMITTAIQSAAAPETKMILAAMTDSGVRYFRWGGWKYHRDRPVADEIAFYRDEAKKLAELAARYQVCGIYHTHSGIGEFGASIWDIHQVVQGIDAKHLAINYDIGHATVEGGFGGWINSARLCHGYLTGLAVKDFLWKKNGKGQWRPEWCPLGEGMVDFRGFFQLPLTAPGVIQLHFEYPIGGAEHGDRVITWSREQVLQAMSRDREFLESTIPAGWRSSPAAR